MHTIRLLLERSKLVAITKTWQLSRSYSRTPTSLNRVQENEPIENGNFTSRRKLQLLQYHWKMFPWAVKILYCQIHHTIEKSFGQVFNNWEENIRKPYKHSLCLFRALALPLHGKERPEEQTSKLFSVFLQKLTLQTFEVFVWKMLQQWKILFWQIFSCTILTL